MTACSSLRLYSTVRGNMHMPILTRTMLVLFCRTGCTSMACPASIARHDGISHALQTHWACIDSTGNFTPAYRPPCASPLSHSRCQPLAITHTRGAPLHSQIRLHQPGLYLLSSLHLGLQLALDVVHLLCALCCCSIQSPCMAEGYLDYDWLAAATDHRAS